MNAAPMVAHSRLHQTRTSYYVCPGCRGHTYSGWCPSCARLVTTVLQTDQPCPYCEGRAPARVEVGEQSAVYP